MIQVRKAEKKQTKLKIGFAGPPGSGKTYTMLELARHIAPLDKVLILDTEHGSAEKYSDLFPGWDTVQPSRYDPLECIEIIEYAEKNGYDVLGIDSLSHYWSGAGGALEKVGGASANWKTVTPQWERMIDKIVSTRLHVISTMRAKMAYSFEKNDRGKVEPQRIGIQPVIRDDVEYVFDVYGLLDASNQLTIVKSRAPKHVAVNSAWPRPGRELAERLLAWCSEGSEDRFVLSADARAKFNALIEKLGSEAAGKVLAAAGHDSIMSIPSQEEAKRVYAALQAAAKAAKEVPVEA